MHDVRAIRADPDAFDAALIRRGLAPMTADILALDAARRERMTAAQERQAARNVLSRRVGEGRRTGADTAALEAEVLEIKAATEADEAGAAALDAEINTMLAALPNRLDPDVPDGADESGNV
jgi:seryl-tRNA synthetase